MDDTRGAWSDIPIEGWGRGFFRAWLIVSTIWIAFAVYLALVGLAGYMYWVGPWVLWYAHKYHVPHDKVYIDPEPKDCDFWHAPLGVKDCHYEELAWTVDLKTGRPIDLPTNEVARAFRYDSVHVSWTKKPH